MMNYNRKIKSLFLCLTTVIMLITTVILLGTQAKAADGQTKQYVIDDADILTDSEESKLEALCAKASKHCKTDIVIITMRQGLDYTPMDDYIREVLESSYGYNGSGDNCDAICYAVDMRSRADRIITSGIARSDITQSALDSMREASESKLSSDAYYSAFKKYVNNVERQLNSSIWYALTWMMPVKIIISLVAAIVIVLIMMQSAKAKMTVGGTTYTKNHQFDVRGRRDDFINTTVVTRHIEKSSGGSSGSGGGGGNSGSSGGHF